MIFSPFYLIYFILFFFIETIGFGSLINQTTTLYKLICEKNCFHCVCSSSVLLTHYLIETPFIAFANRAEPDQPDQGLLFLLMEI